MLELVAGANFVDFYLVHPRSINIYDWPTTRFITHLTSPDMSLKQRMGRTGFAIAAMGLHYMNVSMVSNSIFPAPLDDRMVELQTRENRRGLLVMPKLNLAPELIKKMIAEAPKEPEVTRATPLRGNRELVDAIEDASPVRNLQVVYIVMPRISDLASRVEYPESIDTTHGKVPILDISDPKRFPQLYQAALWYDDAHLNEAGARIATRLLAEELQH